MPRSVKAPAPEARWGARSIVELAARLGVHRNSLSAWVNQEGCPGKPFDELQVRVWAAAHGHDCPAVPDPDLLTLLVDAGIGQYVDLRRRSAAASATVGGLGGDGASEVEAMVQRRLELLPGASAYDLAVAERLITYAEAEARERTVKLELDNERKRREAQVEAGDLVPRAALADLAVSMRRRLESVAGDFGSRVADRTEWTDRGKLAVVRSAADAELADVLERLVEGARR